MKKIFITGASQGIGKSLTYEFAKRGDCKLFIAARNVEALEDISKKTAMLGIDCFFKKCDVTDLNEMKDVIHSASEFLDGIDIAILNSGVGGRTYLSNFKTNEISKIFDVNFFGVLHGLETLIPMMINRGGGTIAGVGSLAEARGFPGVSAYCASKIAISHILEAARIELAQYNIKIVSIKPGFVRTAMTANNKRYMPFLMDSDRAAKIIADGIVAGKKVIAFPKPMALFSALGKILPTGIFDYLFKKYSK